MPYGITGLERVKKSSDNNLLTLTHLLRYVPLINCLLLVFSMLVFNSLHRVKH